MSKFRLTLLVLFLIAVSFGANGQATGSLVFEKKMIAAESFESTNVFDIDKDGVPDIFSGSFWYKGPDYSHRKFIGGMSRHAEYYNDFSTIILDVNKDGNPDVITGGWFNAMLIWRENPGKDGEWKDHLIARCGNVESTRAWDMDGDGIVELVPNTPGKPLVIYRLKKESSTVAFDSIKILDQQGHGLGYGDINGDGRGDLIIDKGWLECPADPFTKPWVLHTDFQVVQASVPMLVTDVNKDGLNDIIIGQGHNYGLDWYEQKMDARKKIRSWLKHSIDPNNSQFHSMELADIDNDGTNELITGKRYRAHDDNDPGAHDPVGLYYYKWNGETFVKQIISYGAPFIGKGTGIYFAVTDLNGDNWKDIVVAGKDGLCIFYNRGFGK